MEQSNDLFREILNHGPSQSTLLLVLSEMKKEGRYSEVVQQCRKALSMYPEDLHVRTLLAESYLELGFIGLAETELLSVTSRLSDLMVSYKLQAEIFSKQQRTEEALKALNQYLAHKPDDRSALDLLEKMTPLAEKVLLEESQTPEELPFPEKEITEKQMPETEEISEDMTQAPEDEIEEDLLSEAPELPEAMVQAGDEKLEEEDLLESPEIADELVRAAETVFQEESALESLEIPEDIERALEKETEEVPTAEVSTITDVTLETQEQDEFSDLATPELAEIYYNQGLINEAVSTYEKVLSDKPGDDASRARLAELKALNQDELQHQEKAEDILRARKEKMITVMEDWLSKIRELGEAR